MGAECHRESKWREYHQQAGITHDHRNSGEQDAAVSRWRQPTLSSVHAPQVRSR